MSDTTSTLTWLLRDQVTGPAGKMTGALDSAGASASKNAGLMGKLSSATGGLVTPFSLALGGATALIGGLIGAGKAAADEQKNVEKMTAALKASVPGFDGNTDAIEMLIAKREDLAFSDDELRASLALLVTSTHDVAAASDLQAAAMDLARLKGVDLETASKALAKANQGSAAELKKLGIEVEDGADKTRILTQIQKAAAGQAEAYAKTTAGRWETLQNKFGDVVETVGGAVLPIFDTLADFALNTLIPTIGAIANVVGPVLSGAFDLMGKTIGFAIDHFVKPAIGVVQGLIGFVKDALRFLGILQDEPIPAAPSGPPPDPRVGRAAGGPVDPWTAYRVGENGPETLVMGGQGGTVIPNGGNVGGSPVEIPIVLDGREIARVVDEHLYYLARRAAPLAY